jgi:DNA-binding GntR family transcriptional regulator
MEYKTKTQSGFHLHPLFFQEVEADKPETGDRGLAADRAYQLIKYRILNLIYKPGSLIKDTDLMKSLKLGRTPIREALKRLEVELLVMTRPRQGTYISEISISDFNQQFSIRRQLLSLAAVSCAEKGTPASVKKLESQLDRLMQTDRKNMPNLIRAVVRFHFQVGLCADNYYLQQLLERYCGYTQRTWLMISSELESSDFLLDDYSNLVNLISERKTEEAQALIVTHLDQVHRRILKHV